MEQPPVLILHGWGGSFASTFAANGWTGALAHAGRTVLDIDLPGHGSAPSSINPEDYSDLARSVLGRLPNGPIDVVGYSLGAKVALAMALAVPDRIRRLVLIGIGDNVFAPEAFAAPVIAALENGVDETTPAAVRGLIEYSKASGSSPTALAAVLRRPPNPVLTPMAISRLRPVVQVINGSDDVVALPDIALRDALGDITYVLVGRTDHLQLPRIDAVLQRSIEFINAGDGQDLSSPMKPTQAV